MSLFHLWKFHSMALIAGCILDWLMGDPYWLFHPVRFMGNMISALEARFRRLFPEHLLLAGGVLAGFMCLFWTLIPVLGFLGIYRGLLSFGIQRHWIYICLFVLESFFCGQLLAARSLQTESMKVCSALKEGDIEKARKAVSMIVGRDTAVLDRDGIARAAVETNLLFAGLDSFSFFAISILAVAILWFGGNRIGAGTMEIGDITALTEYTILILFYLMMAQMVIILLPRARVCLERIGEVLDREPEIRDEEEQQGEGLPERRTVEEGEPVVSFENVSFRFADADEDTLSGLAFSCRRGETTAVIGGTGSGKSTIGRLMMRFYDVSQGTVRICGRDVREMRQQDLRERVSYVPQKAWLFSGTIADNLKYGKPDASEEEMLHTLSAAQADFVTELPEGLFSHTAQGGTNFSGGQKQRLAIARALMKKADLYIFDDSFSALDFKTDSALRKALKEETKGAAVLIIAQRINTILNADQIVVLNEGKIAGIGTHRELMEGCSVYQEIAKSQMRGGEE